MSVEPLASLDRATLRERALDAMRSAILSGSYEPGDHLGEVEIAGRLGVSRGTVREALRHLQQEGLVVAGARGMLRVNRLTSAEVRELFRVRAALEGLAVAEVIKSARRRESVAALRASVAALAGTEHDFGARVEADLGFHLLLCRESGNSMLVDSWRHLEGRIRITIMHGGPDNSPVMMAGDRHAPIVDAIEAGDTATAVGIVEDHMASAAEHFAGGHTD